MKVKPLVWRKLDYGDHYVSETLWRCDYWIINRPIDGRAAGMYLATFSDYARNPWSHEAETIEQVKAACKEHHEAQIASLLESQPNT